MVMNIFSNTLKGIVVAVVFLVATTSVHAQDCASQDEHLAFESRHLQTELMVGALRCGIQPHYNEFATRFQRQLVRHGEVLGSYFSRVHGKGAGKIRDRFVTSLANEISTNSGEGRPYSCETVWARFWELKNLKSSSNFDSYLKARAHPRISGMPQRCAQPVAYRPDN